MAYNLQDPEQIDELKAFWARNGSRILGILVIVAAVFAGQRAWNWYQAGQSEKAAQAYAGLLNVIGSGKPEQIQERYQVIVKDYGNTAYLGMAGLRVADAYVKAGKAPEATTVLNDVVQKSQETGFKQIAAIRLAGLLLDQKKYDEALKTLDPAVIGASQGEMAGNIADRRGDVLAAQGKKAEASAEYRTALERLPASGPLRPLVELRLDVVDN